MPSLEGITEILRRCADGDEQAKEALFSALYDELRRLAGYHLRSERPQHTLQPTALVHEAYIRLFGDRNPDVRNRAHFFALAASVMRHVLVDHARARATGKRGTGVVCVQLDDALDVAAAQDVDLPRLDDALSSLESVDPRLARIVEMRYFAGLTAIETAEVLGVSRATVEREWTVARAWLRKELGR